MSFEMPFLERLLDISPGTPGFLTPLFRSHPGSNLELIQISDGHHHVDRFEAISPPENAFSIPSDSRELVEGDAAVWAYRTFEGELILGTAGDLAAHAPKVLASPSAQSNPLAAYDLIAFCRLETKFPRLLKLAFASLEETGLPGAHTWRDAVVLLSYVREDVLAAGGSREAVRDIVVIGDGGRLRVILPSSIALGVTKYNRTMDVAAVFGLGGVDEHRAGASEGKASRGAVRPRDPSWQIIGSGGVARFVLQRPPFNGRMSGSFVTAEGPPIDESGFFPKTAARGLSLAVSLSDPASIDDTLEKVLATRGSRDSAIHLVNIRPMGFGTPSRAKLTIREVRARAFAADVIWIVGNHRQRQTGNFPNSMSVTNTASRYVKALLQSLTWCTIIPSGMDLLQEFRGTRSLGVAGAAAYSTDGLEDVATRLIYSMLCEDVHLHTAKKIVMFWPYSMESRRNSLTVQLGPHTYSVEVISRGKLSRSLDVVGVALGVRESDRTYHDFRDFCISLLSGYDWHWRFSEREVMTFENQGAVLSAWCIQDERELHAAIQQKSDYGGDNLIITNRTVTIQMRHVATSNGWTLRHYSELGRWMRDNYRIAPFKDL